MFQINQRILLSKKLAPNSFIKVKIHSQPPFKEIPNNLFQILVITFNLEFSLNLEYFLVNTLG
jgi:hypothetical protein